MVTIDGIAATAWCSLLQMSRDMTKPTNWVCAQRRFRSAWASAQSDESLRCPHEKPWVLSYPLSAQRRLIRLGGCPGWSESLLGAQSFCCFCHVVAQLKIGSMIGFLSTISQDDPRSNTRYATNHWSCFIERLFLMQMLTTGKHWYPIFCRSSIYWIYEYIESKWPCLKEILSWFLFSHD